MSKSQVAAERKAWKKAVEEQDYTPKTSEDYRELTGEANVSRVAAERRTYQAAVEAARASRSSSSPTNQEYNPSQIRTKRVSLFGEPVIAAQARRTVNVDIPSRYISPAPRASDSELQQQYMRDITESIYQNPVVQERQASSDYRKDTREAQYYQDQAELVDSLEEAANSADFQRYVQEGQKTTRDSGAILGAETIPTAFRGDYYDSPDMYYRYQDLPEEQKRVYDYYVGKGDKESADAYLEAMTPEVYAARAQRRQESSQEFADEHPVAASVASAALSPVSGAGLLASLAQKAKDAVSGEYHPINPNSDIFAPTQVSSTYRQTVSENIAGGEEESLPRRLASFGYDTLMSVADMATAAAATGGVGVLSAPLMSMGAGSGAIYSAKLDGASDSEAVALGLINAATEWFSESRTFGRLEDIVAKGSESLIANMAKEGGEEVFSELVESLAELGIRQDESKLAELYNGYLAEGYSEGEAFLRTVGAEIKDMSVAFAGGALAGGIGEGGAYAVYALNTLSDGNQIKENAAAVADIQDYAAEWPDGNTARYLQTVTDKYGSVQEAPGFSVGRLAQIYYEDVTAQEGQVSSSGADQGVETAQVQTVQEAQTVQQDANVRLRQAAEAVAQERAGRQAENAATPVDAVGERDAQAAQGAAYPAQRAPQNTEAEEFAPVERNAVYEANTQPQETSGGVTEIPVLADTEATARATGEDIIVNGISSVEDGVAYVDVTTDSGPATMRADEIDLGDSPAAQLLDSASRYYSTKRSAEAMIAGYDGSVPVGNYLNAHKYMYLAGLSGMNEQAALANVASYQVDGAVLSDAYYQGRMDAVERRANRKVPARKKDAGVQENEAAKRVRESSEENRVQMEATDRISKALGVSVRIVDNIEGANGYYLSDGEIVMSAESIIGEGSTQGVLQIFSHELTHNLEDSSPDAWQKYRDFVTNYYMENDSVWFEDRMEQLRRLYDSQGIRITHEELMNEMAANATEEFLFDETAVRELCRENRSLAQKVLDLITDIIEKMRGVLKGYKANSQEAAHLRQSISAYSEARALWLEAIAEAKEGSDTSRQITSRFSVDEYNDFIDVGLLKYVDDVLHSDGYVKNEYVITNNVQKRMADDILRLTGVDVTGYSIVIQKSEIGHINKRHGKNGTADHSMEDLRSYAKIPYIINSYDSAENANSASDKYKNADRSKAEQIIISGSNGKITQYVVEAVPDSKARKIYITSSYINIKKEAPRVLNGNKSPEQHVRNESASASTVSIRNNSENVQKKFSLKEPVEQTKDLIALHNLTEQNLLDAFRLGGMPMPSIAIVRAEEGHSKYGPISLVFDKSTIDPQVDSRNRVYGSDAWMPTAPTVEYPVNSKKLTAVESELGRLAGSMSVAGGIFGNSAILRSQGVDDISQKSVAKLAEDLSHNDSVRAAYLAGQGRSLEPVKMPKEWDKYGNKFLQTVIDRIGIQRIEEIKSGIDQGENIETALGSDADIIRELLRNHYRESWKSMVQRAAVRNKWTKEQTEEKLQSKINSSMQNNVTTVTLEDIVRHAWEMYEDDGRTKGQIDRYATADALRAAVKDSDVEEWVAGKLDGVLGEPGIYNGKERFTPSGNRKSFGQLHYSYTLENIIRAMQETQEDRGAQAWGATASTVQAVTTPEYGSIEEIKEDSSRLGRAGEEDYNVKIKSLDAQIEDIIAKVKKTTKAHSSNPYTESEIIGDVMLQAARGKRTVDSIMRIFKREGYVLDKTIASDMRDMFEEAAALPTEYFEAKPQRAVGFDEVRAALIPDNAKSQVKSALAENGVPVLEYRAGDDTDRLAKLNSVENVRFSQQEADKRTYAQLLRQNERLQELNTELKRQLKLTKEYRPKASLIRAMSKGILQEYNSMYNQAQLEHDLDGLFRYIANAENIDNAFVAETAQIIARNILNESRALDTTMRDQYSGLLSDLRRTKITVSEQDKGDFGVYGGFAAFRRQYRGKLNIVNEGGISVDTLYQELAGQYPELFDAEQYVTVPDQLMNLADTIDSMQPQYVNQYGMNNEEAVAMLAYEIYDRYFITALNSPTFADRKKAQLEKTRREYRGKIERTKQEYRTKNREALNRVREQSREKIANLRAEQKAARGKQKAFYEEKIRLLQSDHMQELKAQKQRYAEERKEVIKEAKREQRRSDQARRNNRTKKKNSVQGKDIPLPKHRNSDPEVEAKLREARDKYGVIPPGERISRDIDVPASVQEGTKVRRFARTVMESGSVTDEMVDGIENEILKGAYSYYPLSNQDLYDKAKARVDTDPEAARAAWEYVISGDKVPSASDIALGEALLKYYGDAGDAKNVINMSASISAAGTRAGQTVSALRILKSLTEVPGSEYLGDLAYIKKTVDAMNRDLANRKRKKGEEPVQIEIDMELAEKLAETQTEKERLEIEGQIYQDLADQLPVTWVDRWNAWRYLSMLGNPRTHIRNIMGNAIFMPAVKMKNIVGGAIEAGLAKRGKVDTRTKAVAFMTRKEFRDYARKDFELVKDIITGSGKFSLENEIVSRKSIFRGRNIFSRTLEKLRKTNSWALEGEDAWFMKRHYISAMAQYLQANKIDVSKEIDPAVLNQARMYAIEEAQKATYRDASAVAQKITELGKDNVALGLLVNGVLPFRKTPINVLKRGVEYSPAGLIHALTAQTAKLRRGDVTINQWIDGVSSGLTGTAIMIVGAFMAAAGWLRGGLGDDDELEELAGYQGYSIRLGDYTYTIDWMAPGSMPLFVGAELYNMLQEDYSGLSFSDVVEAMSHIADPMLNMSLLSGLNDAIDAVSYDGDNKLSAIGIQILLSYFSQAMPTVLGQAARTVDPTVRTTYSDRNSWVPSDVQYFLQKMVNRIPFLSRTSEPLLNEYGEELENGNILTRALENFVSPGYVERIRSDDVTGELMELYDETGEAGVIPQKAERKVTINGEEIHLTAEQYTELQTLTGQSLYSILDDMIDQDAYENLTPEARVSAVRMVYEYAKNISKKLMFEDYNVDSWITKAYTAYQEYGTPVADTILARVDYIPAITAGNIDQANEYIETMLDNGIMTTQAIRSAITSEFKQAYINGTKEERREIERILTKLRIRGGGKNSSYTVESIRAWLNE